jgi:hypothetical protein
MNLKTKLEENNLIFIYGSVYSGKYMKIIKELDEYNIYQYDYLDFYYNNDWVKKLQFILNYYKNVNFFFEKKKQMIIIKEVEIISFKKIKTILQILGLKKNKIKLDIKIILIGSGKCIKQKKDLFFFDFIEYNGKNHENINKMNFMKKNNFNENICMNNDFNIELYDNVKNVFSNNLDITNFFNIYNNNKILLPLLIHENYKSFLSKNIKNQKNLNQCIIEISDIILFSEQIDEHIFNKHKWNLQKLYSIISCQHISYIMNHYKLKKNIIDIKINYTRILTKNSTKSSNMKNYIEIFNKIKHIHNFDYTYVKFINKMLLVHLTNNTDNYRKELNKIGYCKKDFLKIIRNTNEFYYINKIDEIKKLI